VAVPLAWSSRATMSEGPLEVLKMQVATTVGEHSRGIDRSLCENDSDRDAGCSDRNWGTATTATSIVKVTAKQTEVSAEAAAVGLLKGNSENRRQERFLRATVMLGQPRDEVAGSSSATVLIAHDTAGDPQDIAKSVKGTLVWGPSGNETGAE
jgi:hypothetical protein